MHEWFVVVNRYSIAPRNGNDEIGVECDTYGSRIVRMYMVYAQIQRRATIRETNRIRNELKFIFRNENHTGCVPEVSRRSVINRFFDEQFI